jgi:signal transduction histidine kinase
MSAQKSFVSTRGLRFGFVTVVLLLTSGASFSVLSAWRASERIDPLVAASLERERLIGVMRLDAALLIRAADDHINATNDAERARANQAMDAILVEIQDTSSRFTAGLPSSESALWSALSQTAERLVKTVDVTVKASRRAELERARKHLEEEAKPISLELDELAGQLAQKNTSETRLVVGQIQAVRQRTSLLGVGGIALALIFSVLVAWRVTRTLERQETTIDAQLAELNRRNAELDAFASRVAHDLVSPLSPLKGYLTLARRQASEPAVKELLTQAESSTGRMSELVDGLLRFCRAGTGTDRSGGGELDTAVSTILLEQAQAAKVSGVELVRALEARVGVQCPSNLLQSIAQNLVGNAVKYTAGRPEARVRVAVRKERSDGVLEVIDNGAGMTAATQAQLFQPFFRASETRALPGTGLGLATTRRLVEAHGGSISVTSALGQGTTVVVRLPLKPEAGLEKPPEDERSTDSR